MMNGMITDKGIFDAVWCSVMWLDSSNDNNRVKPERDYDPLESIYDALYTGIHSKWVFVDKTKTGGKALPYGESFWIHVPFTDGKFLLTTHEVYWDGMFDGGGKVTIVRNKKYDPRDEEAVEAEKNLQVLMIQHAYKFFTEVNEIKVVSRYPSYPTQETADPSRKQVEEADDWAYQILDQMRGNLKLVPRHDKCPTCWWHSCPSRKVDPVVPSIKFRDGKSRCSGVLD